MKKTSTELKEFDAPNIGRVIFWMTGALMSFSVSALAVRALGKQFNTFEILAIRYGAGLLLLLALAGARPSLWRELSPRHIGLHFARNSAHFIGQYCWVLAVMLLPFATVFALEFTTPAWVALLAALLLGERMTRSRFGSVLLGFLGVLVIVRPGLATFQPLALLVPFAAFAVAISLIFTKRLTKRVSTFAIIFWMNLITLPMALAYPLYLAATAESPLFVFRLNPDSALPTIAWAISGLSSHYCLTRAFRSGDATVVVPMDFLRVPLIAVVGWTFYGEPLDAIVFGGAALIVLGVLWNVWTEARQQMASGR